MKPAVVLLMVPLALAACHERRAHTERVVVVNGEPVGQAEITGASVMSNAAAIDRLVGARCDREVACANVGIDKHFVTREVCTAELREHASGELRPTECPGGIDGAALDACLASVRDESCTNPIDTISRLSACKTSNLCIR